MSDSRTPQQRHDNMAAIRSKNTRPEIIVRQYLWRNGFRFRLHDKKLPGRPDLVLPRYRTAIFVNGCFWHGHTDCPYFRLPKTNTDFWSAKIARNRARDARNIALLHSQGWYTITVWECQLRRKDQRLSTLHFLESQLHYNLLVSQNPSPNPYDLPDEPLTLASEPDFDL